MPGAIHGQYGEVAQLTNAVFKGGEGQHGSTARGQVQFFQMWGGQRQGEKQMVGAGVSAPTEVQDEQGWAMQGQETGHGGGGRGAQSLGVGGQVEVGKVVGKVVFNALLVVFGGEKEGDEGRWGGWGGFGWFGLEQGVVVVEVVVQGEVVEDGIPYVLVGDGLHLGDWIGVCSQTIGGG